jgi:hypothetical protein
VRPLTQIQLNIVSSVSHFSAMEKCKEFDKYGIDFSLH